MSAFAEPEGPAVPYSQIPYVPRRYLWTGVLPVGTPVVFAAAGGTGKGMLMSAAMARVVLGLPWPGEDPSVRHDPKSGIWISGPGEDDQWEDVAPRLRAALASAAAEYGLDGSEVAGALGRVYDLSQWADDSPVTLPADCGRLSDEIARINESGGPAVGLVVADSLSALLSDGYTIDSRQGARRVMGALGRFARTADVSLSVLHHLTKDGKVAGSPAVLDAVRLAFMIERDPDRPEIRTIRRHKANSSAANPQQYIIAGDEPDTHAVFTDASGARAERVKRAAARAPKPEPAGGIRPGGPGSFSARLAAMRPATAPDDDGWLDPEPVPVEAFSVIRLTEPPGGRQEVTTLPGAPLSRELARQRAEADAGRPLTWKPGGRAGTEVCAFFTPDGGKAGYTVRPVSPSGAF